jgi:hypothetical protein
MTCGASASEVADGDGLGFGGGGGLGFADGDGLGFADRDGLGFAELADDDALGVGDGLAVVLGAGLGELAAVEGVSGRGSGASCGGAAGRAPGATPLMSRRSLALPLSVAQPRSPAGAPMPHDT